MDGVKFYVIHKKKEEKTDCYYSTVRYRTYNRSNQIIHHETTTRVKSKLHTNLTHPDYKTSENIFWSCGYFNYAYHLLFHNALNAPTAPPINLALLDV